MKIFQLILLCLACVAKSYSQGGHLVIEITKEHHKVSSKVIQSVVPRADSTWMQSLEKRLNKSITVIKHAKKGKYLVSVVFIVPKDGNLCDVECDKDPGFGVCEKVLSVVKKSLPVPAIK